MEYGHKIQNLEYKKCFLSQIPNDNFEGTLQI
jgi:hypothetical protein